MTEEHKLPRESLGKPQAVERRKEDRRGADRRTLAGLFVNRAVVKRYCVIVVVIMMIASGLIGFVIHQTIKQSLEREAMRVTKVSVYDALMEVNNKLLFRVFIILLLSVFVTAVAGILFLARITGPVYRIRRVLKVLADGKVPDHDVILREGDFFIEVADELNRLIIRLRADCRK